MRRPTKEDTGSESKFKLCIGLGLPHIVTGGVKTMLNLEKLFQPTGGL